MKRYSCIESFVIDACDDDGFVIENSCMTIKKGSKWILDECEGRVLGGEVRLESYGIDRGIYSWIEIDRETFESHFNEIK